MLYLLGLLDNAIYKIEINAKKVKFLVCGKMRNAGSFSAALESSIERKRGCVGGGAAPIGHGAVYWLARTNMF